MTRAGGEGERRDWYTARELAEMRLPGLPGDRTAIARRADREAWPSRPRTARGGGREYPVDALPPAARVALARRLLAGAPEIATPPLPPARPIRPPAGPLRDWQRETMDARAALLVELDRLQVLAGLSRSGAAERLAEAARAGTLRPELTAAVVAANARGGRTGTRTLSRRTLLLWAAARDAAGDAAALAPRDAARPAVVPPWARALLEAYARPQKPSLASCIEDLPALLPPGVAAPSYDQAKRFLRSMSAIDRHRGRMGGRALRNMRAYVTRDFEGLWPTAVYVADGHTFDAEVQHPRHGQPFRPEVTVIIDVATRTITGWSVAIVENTWGVADAMRRAFETRGVCAIWYVDRGSGFNNAAMDDPATGFIARLGVHKENSLPYSSQARGVVERVHQSCLVRAAKRLPTYVGAAMDKEAKDRVHKIVRADVKAFGRSRHLMPWADFLEFVAGEVAAYNDRRHSELGMSPNDRWARLLREQPDTVIERLTPTEAEDAFRPHEERITRRGEIELYGNRYFLRALEHHHGETVVVAFDIHDASQVWVRDRAGVLLGVAELDGNKVPFFPAETFAGRAQRTRTEGRRNRLQADLAVVEAELGGAPPVLDHRPATTFDPVFLDRADRALERMEAVSAAPPAAAANADGAEPDRRPVWRDDIEMARWVLDNPDRATARDREYLRGRLTRQSFRALLEAWDLDEAALSTLCREVSVA